jgi:hypothetical protein
MIPSQNFFEQIVTVIAVIVSFGFTGQYMVILLYFFLRPSAALLKYDEEHFYYKDKKIPIKDIKKIDANYVHLRTLPWGVPGFLLQLENGEVIEVPTYYTLLADDFGKYAEQLKKLYQKLRREKAHRD